MCRGSIRINHSSKDRMGETVIRIKIRAKDGVIIRTRTVRTIKGMDGEITRKICRRTELMNHLLRKRLTENKLLRRC